MRTGVIPPHPRAWAFAPIALPAESPDGLDPRAYRHYTPPVAIRATESTRIAVFALAVAARAVPAKEIAT